MVALKPSIDRMRKTSTAAAAMLKKVITLCPVRMDVSAAQGDALLVDCQVQAHDASIMLSARKALAATVALSDLSFWEQLKEGEGYLKRGYELDLGDDRWKGAISKVGDVETPKGPGYLFKESMPDVAQLGTVIDGPRGFSVVSGGAWKTLPSQPKTVDFDWEGFVGNMSHGPASGLWISSDRLDNLGYLKWSLGSTLPIVTEGVQSWARIGLHWLDAGGLPVNDFQHSPGGDLFLGRLYRNKEFSFTVDGIFFRVDEGGNVKPSISIVRKL